MITLIQQPQIYSPINNPVNFQLRSNTKWIVYYLLSVLTADNKVIANQKYYSLPTLIGASQSGTYFNLASILSNLVDYQLINTNTIVEPLGNSTIKYKLKITEYVNQTAIEFGLPYPTDIILEGDSLDTGLYNVWNGGVNRIRFSGYDYKQFVINSTTASTQFLTDKPLVNNIYKDSNEYLYLLNNTTNSQINIKFYGVANALLGSQLIPLTASQALRLNVSPNALNTYFGTTFNNLYGDEFSNVFTSPFGSYANMLEANYYIVQIVSNTGAAKGDLRTYIMKDKKGCRQSFQLFFSTPLGSYDSIDLFNPRESVTATKTSISNYPYMYAGSTFTNVNNGIFNETSTVINTNSTSTYKAITDVLSDEQSKFLRSIISAEKVYLRLANGVYFPVSLSTTSYNIQSKRLSTNNNRLELEFTSDVSGIFD